MNTIQNASGGRAFKLSSEEGLAKIICVGILGDKMALVDEKTMIDAIKEHLDSSREEFVAKLAIYAKKEAKMKDVSAYLLAYLASIHSKYGPVVFSEIISDISMLKKFMKFVRDGKTSRKSFGSTYKNLIRNWLESRSDLQLFRESVGNDPSLEDIIRMVHPKPKSQSRDALYSYFLGNISNKNVSTSEKGHFLPQEIKDYLVFCQNPIAYGGDDGKIPNTNIMMVMSHSLSPKQWESVAMQMTFNQLIKNLSVLIDRDVFSNNDVLLHVYQKLSSPEEATKSNQLPYTIAMAINQIRLKANGNSRYFYTQQVYGDVYQLLIDGLENALRNSFKNVPTFDANIALCIDVSGSMQDLISSKSIATYLDAASVLALSFLTKNPKTTILPFCTRVHDKHGIDANKSFSENVQILKSFAGGGTYCSAPINYIIKTAHNDEPYDLIIMISDNQSWEQLHRSASNNTPVQKEFDKYKKINPNVKLVNIDISPYANSQAKSSDSIMLVSGFNDSIFKALKDYLPNSENPNYWVSHINNTISI